MFGGMLKRVEQAFTKLCVLFIRQSTISQKLFNTGSGDVQFQQMRHLEKMNVAQSQIITIDARGESGRAEVERQHYQDLIRHLETGTVGVLVLARFDRVGRNRADSDRVLRLLAECGGVLLIDGRLYDPRQPQERFSLDLQSSWAEYENRARMLWLMVARLSMARRMRTAVPLATGLVWFPVRDASAVARMRGAGLGEWLDRLSEHRAMIGYEPSPRYVLPYPDRAVYDAARLRIQWLLETQDLAEVRARIRDPRSGWPRPGLLPLVRSSVYGAEKLVSWLPMEVSSMATWYLSPSLYSIYAYTGRALAEHDDIPLEENTIWEPHAFPSYAEPEDLVRVKAILDRGSGQPWKRRVPYVEHLLPNVRCARPRADGRPCGRRMAAVGQGGDARYATQCSHPGTNGNASRMIEGPVVTTVLEAWRPDAVRASLEALRVERDATLVRRSDLKRHYDTVVAQARAARNLAIEARAAEDGSGAGAFMDRQRELEGEARSVERELAGLEAEEGAIRGATEADYARVMELASDLPRLLEAARSEPETMRRLIGELTEAVHVRPIAHGVVEVHVQFPTGARIRTVVETHPTVCSQAERVYAARRLESGASPEVVAGELNEALAALRERAPSNQPFSPRQVGTMAAMHRERGDEPARDGVGLSPSDVAEHYGVTEGEAREAVLRGRLGPAGWSEGAELTVVPTEEEAGRAFPTWARTRVAAVRGWPAEDVVLVEDIFRELGIPRAEVLRRAGLCSGREVFPRRRLWVRRSEVTDPEAVLRERLRAARPELDPERWERLTAASERLGFSRHFLRQKCEVVTITWSSSSESAVYVWLGPDVLDRLDAPALEQEVARVAPGVDPSEFVLLGPLVRDLTRRTGTNMMWRLRTAIDRGRIESVTAARKGRGGPTSTYVRVPPHVRAASDKAVVISWLEALGEG